MKRFVCQINNILTRIGKPFTVTGIILILVMLFGACGPEDIPEGADEIEYTDVEYSEDGTGVTLYLDGIGVPKTPAQRAMTKDLAIAAYDFIEVIFVNGSLTTSTDICRVSWVLGKPAEINNVAAGNYTTTSTSPAACMFVGRDDGKVLFGVGKLTHTDNVSGTTISATTKSVKFTISPIRSGLLVNGETVDPGTGSVSGTQVAGVMVSSFSLTDGFRKNLGDGSVGYPVYVISTTTTSPLSATYTFSFAGAASEYTGAIKYANAGAAFEPVQKRTPRYAMGERYKEPRSSIDTKTTVALTGALSGTFPSNGQIGLQFTINSGSGGLFAFNIQLPVYMVSNVAADRNGGPKAVTWYIRTGIGAELYSLDDGVSRGGCVLMYVSNSATASADFDKIEWTWFKGW